jgi:hypothetical protein
VIAYSQFRRSSNGEREPIAGSSEVKSLAAGLTVQQQFWGKVTSTPPKRLSRADLELTAFRLGVSVEAAKRAIELGLL